MDKPLEEQSLEIIQDNRAHLAALLKSPGWAILVEHFDARISLTSASLAQECSALVDILGKEFRGGMIKGYSEIAGTVELLIDECDAILKDRLEETEEEVNSDE